jgi:hypothetical protein
MRKFLGKKPVMIAFIVLAVIFLAVEIGILVRPVSYGLNYTNKTTIEGVTSIDKINIKSDSVARSTSIEKQEGKEDKKYVADMWIYRDGNRIYMVGVKEYVDLSGMDPAEAEAMKSYVPEMKKEDYKKVIDTIKEAKDKGEAEYKLVLAATTKEIGEFGIFKYGEDNKDTKDIDESYTNVQAIVFVIVHGVVTLAMLSLAGLAVFYAIKKK